MNTERIKHHWKPIWLRANRIVRGLSIGDIADRMGICKAQVNAWELGNKFATYRRKELIYQAYGVTPEEAEPDDFKVARMKHLLTNYSREEIQMAFDMLTAEERHERYKQTRERHVFQQQLDFKASSRKIV